MKSVLNFISEGTSEEDKDLFFGPLEPNDEFIVFPNSWSMAHIMHKSGNFPSVSQARKNGWNREIPVGFTMETIGKKSNRREIFTLNVVENKHG